MELRIAVRVHAWGMIADRNLRWIDARFGVPIDRCGNRRTDLPHTENYRNDSIVQRKDSGAGENPVGFSARQRPVSALVGVENTGGFQILDDLIDAGLGPIP